MTLGLHPGVSGPKEGAYSVKDNKEAQLINDGRPDNVGVATINYLASPRSWSNIGSRIRFLISSPNSYKVSV